jgi:hypothetical protein
MQLELDKGENNRATKEFYEMAQDVDLDCKPFLHNLSGAVLTNVGTTEGGNALQEQDTS